MAIPCGGGRAVAGSPKGRTERSSATSTTATGRSSWRRAAPASRTWPGRPTSSWSVDEGAAGDPADLAGRHPRLVVVAISPYGLEGPYADRPATEFTVQADSGAVAIRGTADRPPIQMGGRIVEWVAGAYAAVGALASRRRQLRTGAGDLIDVSVCEVANVTGSNFSDLFNSLAGRPALDRPARTVEIPSIEPTADGWVGFNTNTREQFDAFCLLIERPDLLDGEWWRLQTRQVRADEWNAMVREWTTAHPTAEIVERAALLRIPVAPVSDGDSRARVGARSDPGHFPGGPDRQLPCAASALVDRW